MSRSYRKTPISSWTKSLSNKIFQNIEHRRFRKACKQKLHIFHTDEDLILPSTKKYGNEWDSPRDGKMYFGNLTKQRVTWTWCFLDKAHEEVLKDQKEEYKRLMRK